MTAPTEPKTITLGNATYEIPPLPLGVQMKVVPKLMNLGSIMRGVKDNPGLVTEQAFADMIEVLFQAVSFSKKDLKREDFLALAATMPQIRDAFVIVGQQAGLSSPDAGKAGATGEGSQPDPQTSTP